MRAFALRKGLDLPIEGAPQSGIQEGPTVSTVAVLGEDYIGLKPRLEIAEGDTVARGTAIFADKDTPNAKVVSPVAGRITAINRGARRKLISVEIEADGSEAVDFSKVGNETSREGLIEKLCAAGLWTSFRTRPYSKVPQPDSAAAAIFITAMDSEPLSADASEIIADSAEAFSTRSALRVWRGGNKTRG